MRFLIGLLLFCCAPALAQLGGDSRFYRTYPIPREGLVVDLDFSQFVYSGGVYTIRNMANAAAPAYMYGGFDYNTLGSDSSGISRDPHTEQVVMALDGSNADTVTSSLITVIDSTDNWTVEVLFKPGNLSWAPSGSSAYIYSLRYDTSGAYVNAPVQLRQKADTLMVEIKNTLGSNTGQAPKIAGVFTKLRFYHIMLIRSGTKRVAYVDGDSVWGTTIATNVMQMNKIKLGTLNYPATSGHLLGKMGIVRLSPRALSAAERTSLYENAIRDIHARKKFSRW